jgi:hypothetical protein
MRLFEGFFKGAETFLTPLKNPKKCPIICFAPDKKNYLEDFQNQRHIGIFLYIPERDRDRESKRERERERDSERERAREQMCGRFFKMKNPLNIEKNGIV